MENRKGYEGYAIIPQKGIIAHRSEILTQTKFYNLTFDLPVIPSNMRCCISEKLINGVFSDNNIFTIMHRWTDRKNLMPDQFQDADIDFVENFIFNQIKYKQSVFSTKSSDRYISFSIGADPIWIQKLHSIIQTAINSHFSIIITIDVAHGHSNAVISQIKALRKLFLKEHVRIIAGNVMTLEGVIELAEAGADAIKVGMCGGNACTSYFQTGVGCLDMFKIIQKCAQISPVPIIADGGVKNIKDICLALVAGADFVMIGSQFAACIDSPAELIKRFKNFSIKKYKNFYGSASAKNKGENKYVEGLSENLIPCKGPISSYLKTIKEGIQSMISYVGCKSLQEIHWTDIKIEKIN